MSLHFLCLSQENKLNLKQFDTDVKAGDSEILVYNCSKYTCVRQEITLFKSEQNHEDINEGFAFVVLVRIT